MSLRLRLEALCGAGSVRGDGPMRVTPPGEAALASALRACDEARVGCGLAGLWRAEDRERPEVLFDLERFRGFALRAETHLLVAGAGLPVSEIEQRLREEGFSLRWGRLPPLPLGVWLALHAGALHSPRALPGHGPVAAVDALLWDGTPLETTRTPRAAMGPELAAFFLGARARCGLMTRAVLRIHPRPEIERRLAWRFPDAARAVEACVALLEHDLFPDAMGFLDLGEGGVLAWLLAGGEREVELRASLAEVVAGGLGGERAPAEEGAPVGASEIRAVAGGPECRPGARAWARFSQIAGLREAIAGVAEDARLHLEAVAPEGAALWIEGIDAAALGPVLARLGIPAETPPAERAILDRVAAVLSVAAPRDGERGGEEAAR